MVPIKQQVNMLEKTQFQENWNPEERLEVKKSTGVFWSQFPDQQDGIDKIKFEITLPQDVFLKMSQSAEDSYTKELSTFIRQANTPAQMLLGLVSVLKHIEEMDTTITKPTTNSNEQIERQDDAGNGEQNTKN